MKKYYAADTEGGGDKPNVPPKGYVPLTVDQRGEWNKFLDFTSKQKNIDLNTNPDAGKVMIRKYNQENPDSTLTQDHIVSAQYEQYNLRKGDKFGDLSPEQLKYIRTGFSKEYADKPVSEVNGQLNSATAKLYYPQGSRDGKDYGTDVEGYANALSNPKPPEKETEPTIPLPNYNDQKSRNDFLQKWSAKYGNLEGRGDTVLKVNEVPRGGSDTIKNISIKTAGKYGLDPALLYSSAMEEGASGLFKDKSGVDTKHRKPGDFGYQSFYGDKEFPINGNESMGLPDFTKRFPDLVKGGYLPKEFASKFRGKEGEFSSNDFKTVEDGMQAKAALIKYNYDDIEKYAASKGIKLSTQAKDFFALAGFNGGEGTSHKLITKYRNNGQLEDDKFLKQRPDTGGEKIPDNQDVYSHVMRRIKMAQNLKKERLFDDTN